MKSEWKRVRYGVLLGLISCLPLTIYALPYPFNDDFEGGLSSWSAAPPWGLTSLASVSPSHSVADSPGGYYANNTDASLEFFSAVNLSNAVSPSLSFWHRYEFEEGWDFGQVEISTNGGTTWILLPAASYTGSHPGWVREQLELGTYAGLPNVKIRFRVLTDGSVTFDGWHVDNVRLGEAPPAVTLGLLTNTANTASLGWTASAAGDFAAYRIYRSSNSNDDWRIRRLVAEVSSQSTTNYTDITVCPKTRYYYQVMVITTNDLHRMSNIAGVMTQAGMDFPFMDNAEAGGAIWVADSPWALSEEVAASPTHAWTDSPGTSYANGIDNRSITLAAPLNLVGAHAPALSFDHQYAFLANDYGLPEFSTNNGVSWVPLTNYTAGVVTNWLRERLSLAPCTNSAQVLVRFRITTDATGVTNGWFVDNIAISEAPATVSSLTISNVGPNSVCLAWGASPATVFDHYAIHRSTNADVGINSTLVTQITDRASTVLVDTGLKMDTVYYYRAYAVNAYGAYSFDATLPLSARTLIHPVPFSDTMEGEMENWTFSGGWGRETLVAHSGAACLNDSPGGYYGNSSDGSAQTAVNLNGSTWPVLKFWDRYNIGVGDYSYVEVSVDGVTWTRVYGLTPGARTTWAEHTVDLSQWRQQSNLRIRFRTMTDGATGDDGWFVDDVSVSEYAGRVLPLPFHDAFESGALTNNWLDAPGTWMEVTGTNAPYEGLQAAQDTLAVMAPSTQLRLVCGGTFNLVGKVDPQWVFWVRYRSQNWSTISAQVSVNGGETWTALWSTTGMGAPEWKRVQVSLKDYQAVNVRLRYVVSEDGGGIPICDVGLDKITVEERPAGVGMVSAVPHLRTMDVSWTPTTLGSAFQRYEVYRSPDPTITLDDVKIAVITNAGAVSMVDSNLLLNTMYYYGVFTVDTNDVYTPATNEVHGTTWQAALAVPMSNGAETLDSWYTTGTWGLETNNPHSGLFCLNDSSGGNYPDGMDGSAQTAVNLNGSTWPVLKFWDRYNIGVGDYSYVEVSADGVTWTRVYGLTPGARTSWVEHTVDLSQWRQQSNLRIRFRTMTDGATGDDGWFVDDVSVSEYAGRVLPLPFHDAFESGALTNNWLDAPGTWMEVTGTNAPYEGLQAAQDTLAVMAPSTQLRLVCGGTFNLVGKVDPQWVFWVRYRSQNWSTISAQVSVNGGETWTALWSTTGMGAPEWKRVQVSLKDYQAVNVRLRYVVSEDGGGIPICDVGLDKITVEERPAGVGMVSAVPHLRTMDVSWTPTTLGSAFQQYEVYRSPDPTITLDDVKIAVITNAAITNFTDSGLVRGDLYYYGVYLLDSSGAYIFSTNVIGAQTLTIPGTTFSDSMDTMDNWNATGTWGVDTNSPASGTACLSDSPDGSYSNNADSYLNTAIDMTGTVWPVLRFKDRHSLGQGDWGRLEVYCDALGWSYIYGITEGVSTNWTEQLIDLSAWKHQQNLRLRFHLVTDGNGVDSGWAVDDMSIIEHPAVNEPAPFFDGFEKGLGNWIDQTGAKYVAGTNEAYEGTTAAVLHFNALPPSAQNILELGRTLDLRWMSSPLLTFWVKGSMPAWQSVAVQVSTDGGITWPEVWSLWNASWGTWTKVQLSLTAYRQPEVRFRFVVSSAGNMPTCDLAIDNVGIGDLAPGAPRLENPAQLGSTPLLRPVLSVTNAVDAQNDPLTYRFEVYSDAALSNLVSQVPVVAAGAETTSWELNADLANHMQYWWRCRASDAATNGPWMATASFYVNQTFNPPACVVIAGPPPGSILSSINAMLTWYPSSDIDAGDYVRAYHVQIDNTNAFVSPEVNDANVQINGFASGAVWTVSKPLADLAGVNNLVTNTTYFWRVRAEDSRHEYSAWSTGVWWFVYGAPAPAVRGFNPMSNGSMSFEWDRTDKAVYVYFTSNLTSGVWQPEAGPLYGTNVLLSTPSGVSAGFYRLGTE